MYAILACMLLGFAAMVSAQSETTPCDCDDLRVCLNAKKHDKQAPFEKCHSTCIGSSDLQNPSAVDKCFTDKRSAMDALKETKDDCFFNAANGACSASRKRRQVTDGNGQANGQGNGQFNRTRGRFGGKHGRNGFHGGRGFQGVEELKPYHECMRNCSQQNKPQPSSGVNQRHRQQGQQGRQHGGFGGRHGGHGGGFMPGMKECTDSLQCNVTRDEMRQAFTACKSNAEGVRDQLKQIEQTFCVCLRGALNKDETAMPCQVSAAEKGRKGGFRHEGRHAWSGKGEENGVDQ